VIKICDILQLHKNCYQRHDKGRDDFKGKLHYSALYSVVLGIVCSTRQFFIYKMNS